MVLVDMVDVIGWERIFLRMECYLVEASASLPGHCFAKDWDIVLASCYGYICMFGIGVKRYFTSI